MVLVGDRDEEEDDGVAPAPVSTVFALLPSLRPSSGEVVARLRVVGEVDISETPFSGGDSVSTEDRRAAVAFGTMRNSGLLPDRADGLRWAGLPIPDPRGVAGRDDVGEDIEEAEEDATA